MYTYFKNNEIRYIFKSLADFASNIVSSNKENDYKLTLTNTAEQKVLTYGNKTIFLDKVCDVSDDEEWMIEIHDGITIYEYDYPNEDMEDAVNLLIDWLFNDNLHELAFTKTSAN